MTNPPRIRTQPEYYVLMPDHSVKPASLMEWAHQFERINRVVAHTVIGTSRVSTVFLGLDHQLFEGGKPHIFETLVFGPTLDGEMTRCSTWDEAVRHHNWMVRRVRKALKQGAKDDPPGRATNGNS